MMAKFHAANPDHALHHASGQTSDCSRDSPSTHQYKREAGLNIVMLTLNS